MMLGNASIDSERYINEIFIYMSIFREGCNIYVKRAVILMEKAVLYKN